MIINTPVQSISFCTFFMKTYTHHRTLIIVHTYRQAWILLLLTRGSGSGKTGGIKFAKRADLKNKYDEAAFNKLAAEK